MSSEQELTDSNRGNSNPRGNSHGNPRGNSNPHGNGHGNPRGNSNPHGDSHGTPLRGDTAPGNGQPRDTGDTNPHNPFMTGHNTVVTPAPRPKFYTPELSALRGTQTRLPGYAAQPQPIQQPQPPPPPATAGNAITQPEGTPNPGTNTAGTGTGTAATGTAANETTGAFDYDDSGIPDEAIANIEDPRDTAEETNNGTEEPNTAPNPLPPTDPPRSNIPNPTTSTTATITIPEGYAYSRQANVDATEADKTILNQERDLDQAIEMLKPQDIFKDATTTLRNSMQSETLQFTRTKATRDKFEADKNLIRRNIRFKPEFKIPHGVEEYPDTIQRDYQKLAEKFDAQVRQHTLDLNATLHEAHQLNLFKQRIDRVRGLTSILIFKLGVHHIDFYRTNVCDDASSDSENAPDPNTKPSQDRKTLAKYAVYNLLKRIDLDMLKYLDINRDKLLALFGPSDDTSLQEIDKQAIEYTTNCMMLYIKPATCLHYKTQLALEKAKQSEANIRASYNYNKDFLATSKVNEAIAEANTPKETKVLGAVIDTRITAADNKKRQQRQKQKQVAKKQHTDTGDGKNKGKQHPGKHQPGKHPDKQAHKKQGPKGKHPKGPRDQQKKPADPKPEGRHAKQARLKGILKNKTAQQPSPEDDTEDSKDTEEATTQQQSNQGKGKGKQKPNRKRPPNKGHNTGRQKTGARPGQR
jgi:hypothetical protein